MERIHINESNWLSTFPHLLEPLEDEWFAGLLLRCDEANHWESGTTAYIIRRGSDSDRSYRLKKDILIFPPLSFVDCLSEWLAVDRIRLRNTSYWPQMRRLFGSYRIHQRHLTPKISFQVCPECIAQYRLCRRTLVFPQIKNCPQHHICLMKICQCGTPLNIFTQNTRPFSCYNCGMDWAKLPRFQTPHVQSVYERKHLSYFEFFLFEGTPQLLLETVHLLTERILEKQGSKGFWYHNNPLQIISLAPLVAALVRFGISQHEILSYRDRNFSKSIRRREFYYCHSSLVEMLEKVSL